MDGRIEHPEGGKPRLSDGDLPISTIVARVGGGADTVKVFAEEHGVAVEDVQMALVWTLDNEEVVREAFEWRAKSLSDSDYLEEYLERMEAALERVLDGSYAYASERWTEYRES